MNQQLKNDIAGVASDYIQLEIDLLRQELSSVADRKGFGFDRVQLLVVEKNKETTALIREVLTKHFPEIRLFVTPDGDKAMKFLNSETIHIMILSDIISYPEKEMTLIRFLMENKTFSDMGIILLVYDGDQAKPIYRSNKELKRVALPVPFSMNQLLDAIRSLI